MVGRDIIGSLYRPAPDSHKGDNGRVLIIAGSNKYHGALLLAVQVASRIVDIVYVHSVAKNLNLLERWQGETAVFIAVSTEELFRSAELADTILIGPGLPESEEVVVLTQRLLQEFRHKKVVVDASALWQADPHWFHHNVVVTPHREEFGHVFRRPSTPEAVQAVAKEYQCIVVLKGRFDYISNGEELWENHTGNVGMTKGGTGDVLSGLICALAAKNKLLTAALAGTYLSGLSGDRLYERVGTFYNAEDVIHELGRIWHEFSLVQ